MGCGTRRSARSDTRGNPRGIDPCLPPDLRFYYPYGAGAYDRDIAGKDQRPSGR